MAIVERVFSGVQPTGNLHLGNYLGAIVNFVKLQETHNCLYCVVDMHALTQPVEVWGGPAELARNTREVTAAFIASGIDPTGSPDQIVGEDEALTDTRDPGVEQAILTRNALSPDEVFSIVVDRNAR